MARLFRLLCRMMGHRWVPLDRPVHCTETIHERLGLRVRYELSAWCRRCGMIRGDIKHGTGGE